MSVEMTDFNNVAFDRDDVPAEIVDHITNLENDDSSDDDTDADGTLEDYNGEPSVNHYLDDNDTIMEAMWLNQMTRKNECANLVYYCTVYIY